MSYVYDDHKTFKLREKKFSLSGDSFYVLNEKGKKVFNVRSNWLSISPWEKKKLYDMNGRLLYTLKQSLFSFYGRMDIIDNSGSVVAAIYRKRLFTLWHRSLVVTRGKGGETWLEIKGSIFKKRFKMTDVNSGSQVARIRRKDINLSNLLFDKNTYTISVSPGNDVSLMVIIAVALDEAFNDNKEDEIPDAVE